MKAHEERDCLLGLYETGNQACPTDILVFTNSESVEISYCEETSVTARATYGLSSIPCVNRANGTGGGNQSPLFSKY